MAKELKPLVRDVFCHATKVGLVVAHVMAMASGEEPSVAGPRDLGPVCGRNDPPPEQHQSQDRADTGEAGFRYRQPGHKNSEA